jgi:hypothetical protein
MAGTCKENGSGSDAKEDDGRKTMFEMEGCCCSRFESIEDKAVDREDERQRATETGCRGGQRSPRSVAPRGRKEGNDRRFLITKKKTGSHGLMCFVKDLQMASQKTWYVTYFAVYFFVIF